MAIICDKREIILNFMEDKPLMYRIAAVKQQQVTFDKLLDEVCASCGVGRAQAKASIEALLDRSVLFMEYGMSVKFGDFGSFRPAINVKAQKNPEDLGADNVVRRKIVFTPGKRFKKMLAELTVVRAGGDIREAGEGGTGNNPGGSTGNNPGGGGSGTNPNEDDDQDPNA